MLLYLTVGEARGEMEWFAAEAGGPAEILLKLRLDGMVMDEIIVAYPGTDGVYLPLTQTCSLLGIAVSSQPVAKTAGGFVFDESRRFSLRVDEGMVQTGDEEIRVTAGDVMVKEDDIYVLETALSRWLPVTFTTDLQGAVTDVLPREPLPLQRRLSRERRLVTGFASYRQFNSANDPFEAVELPWIDLTLRAGRRSAGQATTNQYGYTGYATTDLFYHTAGLYVSGDQQWALGDVRMFMGRADTEPTLLGPLRARNYRIGDVDDGGVSLISRSRRLRGVTLSNYPSLIGNQLDRHSFRGELPPGWDAELYRNGVLVDYQRAASTGFYEFMDVPLYAGVNRFEVVRYGPQGQERSDTHTFNLGDFALKSGELLYRFSGGYLADEFPGRPAVTLEERRFTAQTDLGLVRPFGLSLMGVILPLEGEPRSFLKTGLRAAWNAVVANAHYVFDDRGGRAVESAAELALGTFRVGGDFARFQNFSSELYVPGSELPVSRVGGHIDFATTAFPALPLSVGLAGSHESFVAGSKHVRLTQSAGFSYQRTNVANQLHGDFYAGPLISTSFLSEGNFYVSRRIQRLMVSGALLYDLFPEPTPASILATSELGLGGGYFLQAGVTEILKPEQTSFSFGFSKSLGLYSAGINARFDDRRAWGVEALVSLGIGYEHATGRVYADARPVGKSGSALVTVFVDGNRNGALDAGELTVPEVSFFVNGASADATTATNGSTLISNLPAYQPVTIQISLASLPDAALIPDKEGYRILPRPGHVAKLSFPLTFAGEVEGTLYGATGAGARPLPTVRIQLVDARGRLVREVRSGYDGYYWIDRVPPGRYKLGPLSDDLRRHGFGYGAWQEIDIKDDGTVASGIDMLATVSPVPKRQTPAAQVPSVPEKVTPRAVATRLMPPNPLPTNLAGLLDNLRKGERTVVKGLDFMMGTAFPSGGAMNSLADVIALSKAMPGLKLRLEVHADMVGTQEQIKTVSEQRAAAIRRYLRGRKADIEVVSLGNAKPVAIGFGFKGKEKNNRVELSMKE